MPKINNNMSKALKVDGLVLIGLPLEINVTTMSGSFLDFDFVSYINKILTYNGLHGENAFSDTLISAVLMKLLG